MSNVYFLGPSGSYSNILAKQAFSKEDKLVPCDNFIDVVDRTKDDKEGVAVLPIENSITSSVHENFDYIFAGGLTIIDEAYLQINLHLITLKGAELNKIKNVYSHPKALAQCSELIKKNSFKAVESRSTADAAQEVLKIKDATNAVIGSAELAGDNELEIAQENVGNEKNNYTRFVFVQAASKANSIEECNKCTLKFEIKHEPGSLANMLQSIANENGNITKIESRPIPGSDWEYNFWIDIEYPELQIIIDTVAKNAYSSEVLGVYRHGKIYQS